MIPQLQSFLMTQVKKKQILQHLQQLHLTNIKPVNTAMSTEKYNCGNKAKK